MLKADLHIHTSEDLHDNVKYTAKQLIDRAAKLKYDVISITNHDTYSYTKELAEYAKSKGILLIPGIEPRIEGKEILLYNFTYEEVKKIKNFEDLRKFRRKDKLIIAPHPFFFKHTCIKDNLIKYIDLFDAIEYCSFYTKHINLNKKSVEIANKFKKTLLGTSDMHNLWRMDYTYSLIDAKKDIISIVNAIRNNKIKIRTKPLPYYRFIQSGMRSVYYLFKKY